MAASGWGAQTQVILSEKLARRKLCTSSRMRAEKKARGKQQPINGEIGYWAMPCPWKRLVDR